MSTTSPASYTGETLEADVVWAFDVDGTLIGSIRSDVLRPGASELLAALAAAGARCVLWSAGGADYARRMAMRHGLEGHFVAFYDKDVRDPNGKYVVDHFRPEHRPHVFVDDSTIDLCDDAGTIAIAVAQFIGNNPSDTGLVSLLQSFEQIMIDLTTTGGAHHV